MRAIATRRGKDNMFKLHIQLSNDAMQGPGDVARALRELADKLDDPGLSSDPYDTTGRIKDANGNTIGFWSYKP